MATTFEHGTGMFRPSTIALGCCCALTLVAGCTSSPAPRRGPLAAMADSVLARFPVACNGPYDCFGRRADTLAYFGSRAEGAGAGEVRFVAYEWRVTRPRLEAVYDSLAGVLVARYGPSAVECPKTDLWPNAPQRERQWRVAAEQVVLVSRNYPPDLGPEPAVLLVRRAVPAECGQVESPPLFK